MPAPPPAMASSSALLGRLNSSAVRALPSDTVIGGQLRVVDLVEHHQIAAAVENGDRHLPGILRRFELGGRHRRAWPDRE